MAEQVIAEISGLQTSNSTFSASPPGSLLRADETVIPQKGVAEPRRGQARAYVPPTAVEIPWAITEFQGAAIINSATDKDDDGYTLGIADNPTTDFSTGPWNPVDSDTEGTSAARMKFGQAGGYLHFCTTTGPKVLESISGDPRTSGLLRMPDCTARMLSATSGIDPWLPYGSSVAYRSVLRLPTSNGTSLLSPPSGRGVVVNRIVAPVGAMTRAGSTVTVTLPGIAAPGLDSGDTFELDPGEADFPAGTYTVATSGGPVFTYTDAGAATSNAVIQDFDTGPRSVQVAAFLSSDATTETPVRFYRSRSTSVGNTNPSDEMFLVAEVFPSSSDITNGFVALNDGTPDSVISDPLYTNPQTGDGPLSANYPPPIYRDVANWGERTWYSNTTGFETFKLQLLGVGTPDGVQDGDTLTIDVPGGTNTPYIFEFQTSPSGSDVRIFSDGTPSSNIQLTAQALIEQINAAMFSDSVAVVAYSNSAQDEAPGKILIQRTTHEDGAGLIEVTASRPASWVPALDATTAQLGTIERLPNGLAYSKLGQPEAVPVVNYTAVGSKNYAIARILGLQQALLVFKEGDGIYSVTGQAPFQVQQISTANIIAPDACALFADSAWVYTDQGILRVSDSGGATVVSRQIEVELNALRAEFGDVTHDYSFAVPYETERRIMFFVPMGINEDSELPELRAFAYNNATQSWSGPLYLADSNAFSGIVSLTADRLLLGVYDYAWDTGRVTLERKARTYLDYADASFSGTISAVSSATVVTLANVTDVAAGDGISQGDWATRIESVDGNEVTLYEAMPFTAAACTIYKHYDWLVQFQPMGSPSSRKTLTRMTWLFKPEWFASLTAKSLLMTDQIQANNETAMASRGFGLNPFGQGPFGDPSPMAVDVNPLNAKWTSAAQFFPGMSTSEVWCKVRMQGVALMLDTATAPGNRGPR